MKEKEFSPCRYCSNVFTSECLKQCIEERKYKHFKLRPGTGIKDLPSFPMNDIINYPDPNFRLVTLSLYIQAITDYLQNEEQYKFLEKAPKMEKVVPDGFRFGGKNGNSFDNSRGGAVPENLKKQTVSLDSTGKDTAHQNREERKDKGNGSS